MDNKSYISALRLPVEGTTPAIVPVTAAPFLIITMPFTTYFVVAVFGLPGDSQPVAEQDVLAVKIQMEENLNPRICG